MICVFFFVPEDVDVSCPCAPAYRPVPPVTGRTMITALEIRRAHRDHGPAAELELAVADRLLAEVDRAGVRRGADESRELGVGIQLEGEERVVAGPRPLLPGVRVRRCGKHVRVERIRDVPARPVVGMVDELRSRRLGVDDERPACLRRRQLRRGTATRRSERAPRRALPGVVCSFGALSLRQPVTWRSNRCAFSAAGAEFSCPSAPR